MSILNVVALLGGLALFLYGMDLMGKGLTSASGGKLERILEKMTNHPLKGVLLGLLVTAVIQSSSATTVMVVGFVNSGIMQLSQAVGIIMGANIGTTVTSWLLSLSGIEGGSLLMTMLKPSSFSPILAFIGIILTMFSKKEKHHSIGSILLGFAILMTGMDAMSGAVKPLAKVPEFASLMTRFSNPLLGLLAGLLLTAIIQSSSASVGILQALCVTDGITFATAFPIIMGQNIGTCVTAIISSVGASRNAKRAACIHLLFNVIGTTLFMIAFYTLNVFFDFAFLNEIADQKGIAIIHSVFNIVVTITLLPFSKGLVKLATLMIKDDVKEEQVPEREKSLMLLEERFLDMPSIGMEQCRNATAHMMGLAEESLVKAAGLFQEYRADQAQEVHDLEDLVDQHEDELGTYLVKLSSRKLSAEDSHTLNLLLHVIGDIERISDYAVQVQASAKELFDKKLSFSPMAKEELAVLEKAVLDIVKMTTESFADNDRSKASLVEPLEEVIDYLQDEVKNRHIKRLREGNCTIEMGFILSDVITAYERMADHCSNIAVSMIQIHKDAFGVHEFLDETRETNQDYQKHYDEMRKIYVLP